jgi:hypothetical protein
LGAPTDPLPSPAPEAGADEAAFLDAEGDPQGAGSGGTDAAAAAVAAERALEDARAQVQGLLGALGSLGLGWANLQTFEPPEARLRFEPQIPRGSNR